VILETWNILEMCSRIKSLKGRVTTRPALGWPPVPRSACAHSVWSPIHASRKLRPCHA